MITPIGFVLQLAQFVKHTVGCSGCSTLDRSNKVGYRNLRGNQNQQVNMISLHIQLYNFATLLLGKGSNTTFDFFSYIANKYLLAVLRHKNYVILAVPYRL